MKSCVLSVCLSLFLLSVFVGCDSNEARTATEGVDADAIAEYEAAVAAAQGEMDSSGAAEETE